MARKVFISFLGTNNYLQTKYELSGNVSGVVRFVQQALIEFLCKDWTEDDSVMIFYTKKSHDVNWLDNGQKRMIEGAEIEKKGLCSTLNDMHFPMKIEGYEIDEGFSEEEIWKIFTCVTDKLQSGDQIYFDVTHAFRSIPLFSVVLFNYARFMKNTKLVSIHYGAFEKLGPAYEVKEKPVDERVAPIIDLTSLVSLQNTNVAASNFFEFGKVGTIGNQLQAQTYNSTTVSYKSADAIKKLREQLTKLDFYIETCRLQDIRDGDYIRKIRESFKTVMNSGNVHEPEKELLRKIKSQLESFGFVPDRSEANVRAAIRWALQYNMLQQAYTLGQESVITKFASLISRQDDWMERFSAQGVTLGHRTIRDFAGGVLGALKSKYQYDIKADHQIRDFTDKDKETLRQKRQDLAMCLFSLNWVVTLKQKYNVLRENRNSLNHGKGGNKTMNDMIREFEQNFDDCLMIIEYAEKTYFT